MRRDVSCFAFARLGGGFEHRVEGQPGGNVALGVDGNVSTVAEPRTFANADGTAVPEPGTLGIFGTALASLALIRRRGNRRLKQADFIKFLAGIIKRGAPEHSIYRLRWENG